jgi:lipopolysaccharide/colanic/teichoic acid biosynthesis glycosyltransferase
MSRRRGVDGHSGGQRLRIDYAAKRVLDIAVSGLLLLFLSPLLLAVGIAVRATSPGPALFAVDWIGKDARPFRGYKLRTMVVGAEAMEAKLQTLNQMVGPAFKIDNDPRITPLGHVLRKYSIDELPQLWSVLKGDMSLVGPRPPRAHEYARFTEFQKRKLSVKPGITCLWQIEGRHRIRDYDHWVARDLAYIEQWSFWLDIKILFLTAIVVLKGTGQ